LEDISVDGIIILICTVKKEDGRVLIGFFLAQGKVKWWHM
jgi:hypothetical protein